MAAKKKSDPPTIDADAIPEIRVSEALALRPPDVMAMQRPPDKVMEEAITAAKVLKDVIEKNPDKVTMNGKTYLRFEDWQVGGRFFGYTVKEDGDVEPITIGEYSGFKASAVGLDRDGVVRSRATALCMNDEEKWSSRAKYAYVYVLKNGKTSIEEPPKDHMMWVDNPRKPGKKMPKKERQLVGTEKVPMFQLASMAQTRASSKAYKNLLAWIAVLAGYSTTPAEEMDSKPEPSFEPAPVEDQSQDTTKQFSGTVIDFKTNVQNTGIAALKLKVLDGKKERIEFFATDNAGIIKVLEGSKEKTVRLSASQHVSDRPDSKGKIYWQIEILHGLDKYNFDDPDSVQQYYADVEAASRKTAPGPTVGQAAKEPAPVTQPSASTTPQTKQNASPKTTVSPESPVEPPKIEAIDVEIPVGRGKNKTTKIVKWYELAGTVIGNSGIRKAANDVPVITIGIGGLADYRANPAGRHNRFDCYHKSLHAALSNAKVGSKIIFQYFPDTTSGGKVNQYIEDVVAVDDLRFEDGKVVTPAAPQQSASPTGLF